MPSAGVLETSCRKERGEMSSYLTTVASRRSTPTPTARSSSSWPPFCLAHAISAARYAEEGLILIPVSKSTVSLIYRATRSTDLDEPSFI